MSDPVTDPSTLATYGPVGGGILAALALVGQLVARVMPSREPPPPVEPAWARELREDIAEVKARLLRLEDQDRRLLEVVPPRLAVLEARIAGLADLRDVLSAALRRSETHRG